MTPTAYSLSGCQRMSAFCGKTAETIENLTNSLLTDHHEEETKSSPHHRDRAMAQALSIEAVHYGQERRGSLKVNDRWTVQDRHR
jgi:hypothetical protein